MLAAVLLGRALATPTLGLGFAIVLASAAAGAAWRSSRQAEPRVELKIDADGAIWRRDGADTSGAASAERLMPSVVSRHVVTFTVGGQSLAIWHDNLPVDRFRRLCAHARWHVERARSDAGSTHGAQLPSA